MSDELQHTPFEGNADYIAALDTLCGLGQHNLYFFEKNFADIGFNAEARYTTLRAFLLANPNNRLQLLTHDTDYLAQRCPRMMLLLRQFSHSMQIFRTPQHLHHVSEPFAVADNTHYVRRFHFDDTRGLLAINDPQGARTLHGKFTEMWESSRPGVSPTTLGL